MNEEMTQEELARFVCDCCGKNITEDMGYRKVWTGHAVSGSYCPDCADSNAFTCEDCGELFDNEMMVPVNEDVGWRRHALRCVCESCAEDYYVCDECGERFSAEYIYRDDDDHCVCQKCYDEYDYITCPDCGAIIRRDDAFWSEENDEYYCEACWEDRDENRFHSYEYKPDPYFHAFDLTPERDRLYLGVELEVDGSSNRGRLLKSLADMDPYEELFYCKSDCSLSEGEGVEIVTHPCDLDYHLKKFPWEKICEAAKDAGYRSHDTTTCGLHVHASRDALGESDTDQDLTIAKLIIIMDNFWNQMVKFSRRDLYRLAQWAKKPDANIDKNDSQEVVIRKAKDTSSGSRWGYDRYKALNLTNDATIEFRLFRGSLNTSTILATLEFVSSLINFCKTQPLVRVQNATWADVLSFCTKTELVAYLQARGLYDTAAPAAA